MKRLIIYAALCLAAGPAKAAAPGYLAGTPLHQKACYKLDLSPTRTSRMFYGGKGQTYLADLVTGPDGGQLYRMVMTFTFDIDLLGAQDATLEFRVPVSYFTADDLPRLRAGQLDKSPDYTMAWIGAAPVTTLDGVAYPSTDELHTYDMHPSGGDTDTFKDLQMWGYITPLVPSLGAAKIDMKGTMFGIPFIAGIDFTTDQSQCVTP